MANPNPALEAAARLQRQCIEFGSALQSFHNVVLLPTATPELQAEAVKQYADLVLIQLRCFSDMRKYYSDRTLVLRAIRRELLRVADEIEKIIDDPDWSEFIE